MKRRKNRKRRSHAVVELTPLIDMVFILLIFFMVTTAFVKKTGVTIERPTSDLAQPHHQASMLIAITRNGQIHAAGQRIAAQDSTTVKNLLTESQADQVIIQADREAPLGLVLQVQDTALSAGAKHVRIGAQRP